MTYLSGLGYLLGLEGLALLRGIREGTGDQAFVERRIAEIRGLLDAPDLARAEGVTAEVGGISTAEVYAAWAPGYDGPNTMIDLEELAIHPILDALPVGTALDAACGTGRLAAYLAQRGHRVIGVEASPEMLAVARNRLPTVELHEADLSAIPLPDNAVDSIVCGLALAHIADLAPVMAEFARVLRPGGHLVISDAHQLLSYVRPTMARDYGANGRSSILAEYHRSPSAYLGAALPVGFAVRDCQELKRGDLDVLDEPAPDPLPTEVSWQILLRIPEAARLAMDVPSVIIWHFQLDADETVLSG